MTLYRFIVMAVQNSLFIKENVTPTTIYKGADNARGEVTLILLYKNYLLEGLIYGL